RSSPTFSVLASYAKNLFEGRDPCDRLAHAVLVHGRHAPLDRLGAKIGGSGVAHDEAAQRVGHRKHFHDADAADVAGLRASVAALLVKQPDLAAVGELAQSHFLDQFGQGDILLLAMRTERADEPLREDADYRRRKQIILSA